MSESKDTGTDKSPDIFSAVKPILATTRLLGLGPFRLDEKKKTLNVFTPGLFYSAVMLFAFTSNAGFLIYTKVVYKDKRIDSYVGLASDMILLTSGIVVTVCCILLAIIQRKKYIRVVRDFYNISFEMSKLNEEIPYEKLQTWSRRYLFILLVILTLLFLHTVFYTQNLNNVLYMSYLYACFGPKVYNFLMEYQFVSGVFLLKLHFSLLNKSLETFIEGETSENGTKGSLDENVNNNAWTDVFVGRVNKRLMVKTFSITGGKFFSTRPTRKFWPDNVEDAIHANSENLQKIKIIRKIHCSACKITKHLNSSFSLQLLTSVAQSFVFITANLYMIFTTLSTSKTFSFLAISHPMLWFATHTVELVTIVLACTKTSKIANYTAVLVHKLLSKDSVPEFRNQIIGAVTTYLVILIQFHNTYEIPKKSYTVTDYN
ncbi:hypothetical protein RUM44_011273 [Polyplax serrata]|uniref:Gustatory receptor n=1 Tax=Polyplax serrata TaxID=468196 RepID=A0ABR1APL7_POLSC